MQKKYNKSSGWIATDWGGESGYRRCMTFYYTARRTSSTARTVTVDWYMQFDGTDNTRLNTYYLAYYNQYLLIQDGPYDKNKSYIVSKSMGPTTNGYENALTLAGSGLDNERNGQAFFDIDGDYTGIERWVWIRGSKFWNGSFTLNADKNGDCSFYIWGQFGWYGQQFIFEDVIPITGLVGKQTYSVTYEQNTTNFPRGNSVSSMPPTQTKTYGSKLQLNSTAPKITNDNYKFVNWNTKSNGTGTSYKPGDYYYTDDNLILYAIWEAADRTVTCDVGSDAITSSSVTLSFTTKYNTKITLPSGTGISRYGYTLTKWLRADGTTTLDLGDSITVLKNETITAVWENNSYKITFKDLKGNTISGKEIRNKYDEVLCGDFSYSFSGYKLVGWNTKKVIKINPGDSLPAIAPNVPYTNALYDSPHTYIGSGKYTLKNPYYVPTKVSGTSTEPRKHMIGKNIALYPIVEYSTSTYVYTGTKWELAMPYVYDDSSWKMSLGEIYTDDKWKL